MAFKDATAASFLYLAPGSGAAPRTVNAKLSEIEVSVDDFYLASDPDDTNAIIRAVASVQTYATSGKVFLRPRGTPYVTSASIILPNGVALVGVKAQNFPGTAGTNAQWTAQGSWIQPNHSASAVVLLGHGSSIEGVNFIHAQPTPGASFTPTTYGYCVECNAVFASIADIVIVNATYGVWVNYGLATGWGTNNGPNSGGGTNVRLQNLMISAFLVGLRTTNCNDVLHVANIHFRGLYFISNLAVLAYVRANAIGWWAGYTDNPMVSGMEFLYVGRGIYLVDETCLGSTHSLYQGVLEKLEFNLATIAIAVASTTTTVVAQIVGLFAQAGNAFGLTWADTLFQLGSDNVDLTISNWRIPNTGGSIMTLGNGVGGSVTLSGGKAYAYSTVSSGQTGFTLAAGAALNLSGSRIVKPTSAGSRFGGAGLENVTTDAYGGSSFFATFLQETLALNGSWQDFTVDCNLRPGQMRVHQARIVGTVYVSAAVASTTFAVRMSVETDVTASGFSSAAVSYISVDTGWIDMAETDLTSLNDFGRIQVNGASGVTIQSGSLQLIWR